MKWIVAILIGLMMVGVAQAQDGLVFTTSGGLTITVPEGYLVAEIAPLRVGLTNRETGALLVLELVDPADDPDQILAAELRRLAAVDIQFPALEIRADAARVVTARATRANGSVMVGQVLFTDGMLGLLTISPADSAPRTVIRPLIDSIRMASVYPVCGSDGLPQSVGTAGGLSVCFPAHFVAEEKGDYTLGLADLAHGVIVSVYAENDLETLIGAHPDDASMAVLAFAGTLQTSGATAIDETPVSFELDGRAAFSLAVNYPDIGTGSLMAVQTDSGVILLSAVLVGEPPADISMTLEAILNSAALTPF